MRVGTHAATRKFTTRNEPRNHGTQTTSARDNGHNGRGSRVRRAPRVPEDHCRSGRLRGQCAFRAAGDGPGHGGNGQNQGAPRGAAGDVEGHGHDTRTPAEGRPTRRQSALQALCARADLVQQEIVPGFVTHMLGYDGSVPGPTFRVQEDDWVWVDFTNANDEMHTRQRKYFRN